MDPKHYLFFDERIHDRCVFCGGHPDTRDHVPSKVFLDDPLPDQLPVVSACKECNQSFSFDEEYLACLLEVVLSGSTDPEQLKRIKIRQAVSRNARLKHRLDACARVDKSGTTVWIPEVERVQNIVIKLSRGHVAYELGFSPIEDPASVFFQPLLCMSNEYRERFERAENGEMRGWPKIGRRTLLRAIGAEPYPNIISPWIEVQSGRYRYSVDQNDGVFVRIVISEYLSCEVQWE
jgi:hypothetical protein